MSRLKTPSRPCGECPWRTDVAPGVFDVERFRTLAASAYDMSRVLFQCHKTTDERPAVCAGFLLRGAAHNLAVRLALIQGEIGSVEDGGYPLFDNYRDMAIANGADPNDKALEDVRSA